MDIGDLLDQVVGNADDDSSQYRAAVLRWLNLCRSEAYGECSWKTALVPDATITTAAATTDGLYVLADHEHVVGPYMWDETNEANVRYESYDKLQNIDPKKETTGQPTWWSDAGIENATSGDRKIYLWPIPDGAYTIRFAGYLKYSDIPSTPAGEELTTDPLFGDVGMWAAAWSAGMRYYQQLDNNESTEDPILQERRWRGLLMKRKNRDNVLPNVQLSLSNVRQIAAPQMGRFNPSHYNNR